MTLGLALHPADASLSSVRSDALAHCIARGCLTRPPLKCRGASATRHSRCGSYPFPPITAAHTGLTEENSTQQRHLAANDSYANLSSSLLAEQAAQLRSQLATFQQNLSTFSTKHRAKILSSPEFRQHFTELCAQIGVDPLGGGEKGFWDKMGVGDWYYALGVQIVDVCLGMRERGGGLVALDDVMRRVELLRNGGRPLPPGRKRDFSEADVVRAVATLEPLGCGYAVLVVAGRKVIRCYPVALDRDSLVVVEVAGTTGRGAVTAREVHHAMRDQGWTMERVERAIDKALLDDGMVWADEQAVGGTEYWVPALFRW